MKITNKQTKLHTIVTGMDPDGTVTDWIVLTESEYQDWQASTAFDDMIDALHEPGEYPTAQEMAESTEFISDPEAFTAKLAEWDRQGLLLPFVTQSEVSA